jgi:hypothetical protein
VDGLPSGGDQIINSITSESQMYPTIASLANGGYVGAWQGYTQSSQRDVFARKFESNGSAVDNDFQCNKGEAGNQEHPSLACYGDDVAVMWFHDGSYVGNGIAGAWVRFFPAQGVASNEVRVSKAGSKVHGYPSLAWIDDQKAVTVWHGTIPGGTSEIGARMVNTSAEALDEVFRVNTCFQGAQAQPALASFSDGSFIVVWKSQGQTDPDNPLDSDIYAQRFNADGTKKYK